MNRRSAPRVTDGAVCKKNRWRLSADHYDAPPDPRTVAVERERPGAGYKHVLSVADVRRFLLLLPDWPTLAVGLHAVVLAPGTGSWDGWHTPGVVHVCAWDAGLWRESGGAYYRDHRDIWERLGVPCEQTGPDCYLCRWDAETVRAYQLLHILLHELGHHHDRMTTRRQRRSSRGEAFAEEYARRHEALIWGEYARAFRL